MAEKLLEVHDLHISFQSKKEIIPVVTGVDFSINQGETLGIVGESGAGKSVLGLSLMRLLPKDTAVIPNGRILYQDSDLLKMSDREIRKAWQ